MRKILFLTLAMAATSLGFSQIVGFNTDAYGFELTNVEWQSTTSNNNGATSPGNIVDAFTQFDGFEQSSEQKRSGSYSLLADFSSTIPASTPGLQGWRANKNGEGNYEYTAGDTPINYTLTAYVYVSNTTDGNLRFTSQGPEGRQYNQLSVDLSTLTAGQWNKVTLAFDQNDPRAAYWSSINFITLPTINAKIFIDDFSIVETSTLSSPLLDKNDFNLTINSNNLKIVAPKNAVLEIYNVLGVKVKSFTIKEKLSNIDVSMLEKNMYICKLTYNRNVLTKKMIKN